MKYSTPEKINTISAYHQLVGISKPEHPLISVINFDDIKSASDERDINMVLGFYSIALKRGFNGKMKYGQQEYDFDEGVMNFMSPGQVLHIENNKKLKHSGYLLLIHPDFLWNTPLAKTIAQYEFFDYAVNEALHLSEKEEMTIKGVIENIKHEYHANIDAFTQTVIIAQIEVLLAYAERFYHRQFITRKISNHKILGRLERILADYFESDALKKGLPSVQMIAEELHVTPNYLSGLLKVLTGQSTQQHIHNKVIEKAKEKLSTTDLTVSEIAYDLGFEHSQSFSKLFKSKTSLSPLAFRQSFQ
ncbi:helix-turn-helix domain-containing protein [Fulvivirga ligni]|uniref:helix-turn-helix domain-containing protein n=1 Tax=Fulvivirga ligni TaxID=2904246 RepID=UPI001F2DB53D|nr:response regulator transcription factor [Fulvivirga ligni]UII21510.1 helix-turn-helix transcriptional regulator [Fulvivirga ligni]